MKEFLYKYGYRLFKQLLMSLGNIVSTMFSENGPKAKEQKREDESRKNVVSKYEKENGNKWEMRSDRNWW